MYQIIGTELSLSNLQQFIILIKWNDRENPKGSHKGKDRYDIYNIQIVGISGKKWDLKRCFAYSLSTTHPQKILSITKIVAKIFWV